MFYQLENILSPSASSALAWTIIHSVWQVSLFALIMSIIHRKNRKKSATRNYNVAVVTMLFSLVASIVTFCMYFFDIKENHVIANNYSVVNDLGNSEISSTILNSVNSFFIVNLEHVNMIWIIGTLMFFIKLVISFGYISFLKTRTNVIEDQSIHNQLRLIEQKLQLSKPVGLFESANVSVPMVIGYLKPLILFPVGMITMLTSEEIEAILVHELFHVKRNDYLINIFLSIVEILYFFHPAMWWISANVKAERENCCDDGAINYNVDAVTYAKALVKLEELSKSRKPSLAMAFSSPKHHLLNRVKRILNMEHTKNEIKEKSIATVLLLFVAVLFSTNVNSQLPDEMVNVEEQNQLKIDLLDTLISGNDQMILKIKKGKFSSMNVDGEKVDEKDLIDKLESNISSSYPDQNETIRIIGNAQLVVEDGEMMIYGDEMIITDENHTFETVDTIPKRFNNNERHIILHSKIDGEKVEITKKNGKITSVIIDGKQIPESDYDKYQDAIDSTTGTIKFDSDFNFDFPNMDSTFHKSFGMILDGDGMKKFEGNIEQLFDEGFLEQFEDMENIKMFDFRNLQELENLDQLKELEQLKGLEGLQQLENLEGLDEILDQMGIQLDSSMKTLQFHFEDMEDFEGFEGLDGLEFFNGNQFDIQHLKRNDHNSTVVDKIGDALNKDGLLEEYKSNEIELSGKHLKINGEKMPKALYNKYKSIYQHETGAPLTKKSKMIFSIEGKPSKRKVRTF